MELGIDAGFVQHAEDLYPLSNSWEITAGLLDTTPQDLMRRALFEPITLNVIDVPEKKKEDKPELRANVRTIPGHRWAGVAGPSANIDVMVIGKMPGYDELSAGRFLCGPSGKLLKDTLGAAGIDWSNWYVTNVSKYMPTDGGKGSLKAYVVRDGATLLAYEILTISPKYLLLLGSDAVSFVLGRKASLTRMRGAAVPFIPYRDLGKLPAQRGDDADEIFGTMATQLMVTVNPAHVLREPALTPAFERDIQSFAKLTTGQQISVPGYAAQYDYRYIDNVTDLNKLVDELIAAGHTDFAVDAEWGGANYRSGWLRTVQFSWGAGHAACIILRTRESQRAVTFKPGLFQAVEALRRLFDRPGVRIIGQNFRSDALWLEDIGVPVMRHLYFDTMLADHALNESQEHGLSAMTVRYTDMGRYDLRLEQWRKEHPCTDGGYGTIPDDILHPYAASDADATYRIGVFLTAALEKPEHAGVRYLFYNIIMPACQPIHDIERNGIAVDTERMIDLLWQYYRKRNELLSDLRAMIHWPTFNPQSHLQKVKLLYGARGDGYLGLTPVKTTEKPSREWDDILALPDNERARVNPSTDAESMELLWADASPGWVRESVRTLQDFQVIAQVCKSFLRPPTDIGFDAEDTTDIEYSLEAFTEGLLGHVAADGRIRTTLSQLADTGRHKSSRPNLQNISKRQEGRYKKIMGPDVKKIRSCFVARPGHVLIEADYKAAEVVVLAEISGDNTLRADARGKIKIHAKVAVDILRAPCGYEEVAKKYEYLYVAAKNLTFGIPYQRGAKAIARQVNRETEGKAEMTYEQARQLIDDWYARYPGVAEYVNYCKWCVQNPPHTISTPWGRVRHFYYSPSKSVMAAQEREAVNFPIQGTVADTLNVALYNLWAYRRLHPAVKYDIILAIHDAVMLEVPIDCIEPVVEEVLPMCMRDGAEIPASSRSPKFKLDIDPTIMFRWGEEPDREAMESAGIPERYWPVEKAV